MSDTAFQAPPRANTGTTPDVIHHQLRDDILRGVIEAGAPLRQIEIAQRFGSSRVPVREALRQLEAEGLVTFHPMRGASVTVLRPEDVLEMFDIRIGLECRALYLSVPNMTSDDFRRAEEILAEPYEDSDASQLDNQNWRFHSALYLPAHRPRLYAMIEANHFNAARFLRLRIATAHGKEQPLSEHAEILAACRAGNRENAVSLLWNHIDSARKALATEIHRNSLRSMSR